MVRSIFHGCIYSSNAHKVYKYCMDISICHTSSGGSKGADKSYKNQVMFGKFIKLFMKIFILLMVESGVFVG